MQGKRVGTEESFKMIHGGDGYEETRLGIFAQWVF